ncbi:MAG: Hsp20 family protein [Bdellovibrionales bacterium]|nr:Hsp20 family protein [Bdellovibrionales bacterium]
MEVDSTTRISQAQSAAAKAEREAAERVTQAQKHVRDAGREEEKQLDHLRDAYEQRTAVERSRGEDYIEAVRNRNYQRVSEMQRQAENDEHRVTTDHEKNIRDTNRRYTDAQIAATRRGEAELKETTERNYKSQEFERLSSNEKIAILKQQFAEEKAQIEADRRDTTATLSKQSQTHRKELEEQTRAAVEESTEHYKEAYEGALKQNRDAMADLNWRASKDIEQLKRDTTMKLDAYSSQKTDPFYRMVNVDGKLTEHADQFVFTAKIPEHERDRININIRGNELIISGKRKSEEALEVEPGRVARTSSYQSFSENFPLNFPVDPKNLTREYDGDTLVVRIPKRATYEPAKPKPVVSRSAAERPHFPKNLPGEAELAKLNDPERGPEPQDERIPPSKRKRTGTTFETS